jgi:hypothetical protein
MVSAPFVGREPFQSPEAVQALTPFADQERNAAFPGLTSVRDVESSTSGTESAVAAPPKETEGAGAVLAWAMAAFAVVAGCTAVVGQASHEARWHE